MLETPVLIKRPVIDLGEERKLGFSEEKFKSYFLEQA